MSGTLMIMFKKGEIKKVKEWFKKVCPEDRTPDLPVPDNPLREGVERGLYTTFSKNVMKLDYAIWDDIGSSYAYALAKEFYKKGIIEKMGWDSVGYCKLEDLFYLQDKSELFRNNIFLMALKRFEKNNLDEIDKKHFNTDEKKKQAYEMLKKQAAQARETEKVLEEEARRLVAQLEE